MIRSLAFLWMSGEGNVWARPVRQEFVFHINTGLFLSTGDGRETVGGGGCHSYHLTHELLQTQVDVDMLQMLVKQSDVKLFKHSHWLSFVPCIFWSSAALTFPNCYNLHPCKHEPCLFIYCGSLKQSTHRASSARDQMARASWIYRPPFCRLRTHRSRSETDNTCRPVV